MHTSQPPNYPNFREINLYDLFHIPDDKYIKYK